MYLRVKISLMDEIDFMENNEFHVKSRKLLGEPQTPTMVNLLLRSGLVKTEKQALIVLIVFICLVFFLTLLILNRDNLRSDYVTAPDGTKYSAEEFLRLVEKGIDPLDVN